MTSAVAELSDWAFSPVGDLPYGYISPYAKHHFFYMVTPAFPVFTELNTATVCREVPHVIQSATV